MKTLQQIKQLNKKGEYLAVGSNGKLYNAHYTTEYGGVMFFCIPAEVDILGYIEKDYKVKEFTIIFDTNYGQRKIVCNEFLLEQTKNKIERNYGLYAINTVSLLN